MQFRRLHLFRRQRNKRQMAQEVRTEERADTTAVFARVTARLQGDDAARSLWQKLQEEMNVGGISSALSYLRSRFTELSERVNEALPRKAGS